MPWSPPYYDQYLVDAGYAHAYPFWFYDVDFAYERYRDFTRRALESPECRIRELDKSRWDEEVETLRLIWNEGFSDEWEFQQYTPEQFQHRPSIHRDRTIGSAAPLQPPRLGPGGPLPLPHPARAARQC